MNLTPPAMRDLADYTVKYRALPFEPVQIEYRRRAVLAQIARLQPKSLLEVGCGERPLFTDLPGIACTVVEPTPAFAEQARRVAVGLLGVRVATAYLEDFDAAGESYDIIIVSCVLHEVPDPQAFLSAVRRLCGPRTTVHINVPNARSLHRLLAVAMGLIPDPATTSPTQHVMQQRSTPYDASTLRLALASAGLEVSEGGTLFIKPFTHYQMQQLLDQGFLTAQMLDGFAALVHWLPDLGSELWVHANVAPALEDGNA